MDDGNLKGLFGATEGVDGIALWGSVGMGPGEDNNGTEVSAYLGRVWAPYITQHCDTRVAS